MPEGNAGGWGDTAAYRQSQERARGRSKEDWLRLRAEQEELLTRTAATFTAGLAPDSEPATALAEEHRLAIDREFYACSHEMHRALGQMYVDDERFGKNYAPTGVDHRRYAEFVRDALVFAVD